MLTKRFGAAVLAACLLVAVAFGGTLAFAAGELPADGENTLTVNAASSDKGFTEDLATANVVVDVYKLADGVADSMYAKYNYTLVSPFASEGEDALVLPDEETATAAKWEEFAKEAAKKVTADVTPMTVAADGATALTLAGDGLYLVMPHGSNVVPAYGDDVVASLYAESANYRYTFAPSITAAPTKAANADGVISTAADFGEWMRAVTITLKPEQEPLYGSLRIVKNVQEFSGKSRAFNFDITGTKPNGQPYNNTAQILFTGGETAETIVTHIPAGTVVTVTERNDSDGVYELVSQSGNEGITIAADAQVEAGEVQMTTATFTNKDNPTSDEYKGIQNKFTLTKTGDGESDWDWVWTAVPSQETTTE